MSTTDQIDPLAGLTRLAEEVLVARETLTEMRSALMAKVKEVDEQLRRVDRIGRAADIGPPAASRSTNGGTRAKKSTSSPELRARVLEALKDAPDGLTGPQVTERLGGHRTSALSALETLREEGKVRLAGTEERRPGQKGKAARLYRVMPGG